MSKQRYSRDFKVEAVKLVTEQGLSQSAAARRLGVTNTTIREWIKRFGPDAGEEASKEDASEELRRLREENRQLRMEREILKKATAFFANPDR